VTVSELWSSCEGRVVNGVFPLRRLLGSSDHSAVFLSQWPSRNLAEVAVKLVPAHPALARLQLAHWSAAAALSHPHLVSLFQAGRWQVGEHHFLFAAMEYAEENLSQVLPQRALTPDEARHMLPPIIGALAFLHGRGLVHGRLKPSNILVIRDQVKLSSDAVRPPGESTALADAVCPYDPPEARMGRVSAAGDIWSLGATLTEALTQHRPSVPDERLEPVAIPQGIPPDLAELLRKCLSRDPDNRPTIVALATEFKIETAASPLPPSVTSAEPERTVGRSRWLPTAGVLAAVALATWGALRAFHAGSRAAAPQPTPVTAPAPSVSADAPPAAAVSAAPKEPVILTPASADPVVEKSIPEVSRSARESIHGRIKVSVRVTVDGSGNVVDESLQMAGPSKYFARLATEAARKWKFAPAADQSSRQWLLWFEFTRDGASAHAQ
jgi:TonB family protein